MLYTRQDESRINGPKMGWINELKFTVKIVYMKGCEMIKILAELQEI